jgi:hypothetical protein
MDEGQYLCPHRSGRKYLPDKEKTPKESTARLCEILFAYREEIGIEDNFGIEIASSDEGVFGVK